MTAQDIEQKTRLRRLALIPIDGEEAPVYYLPTPYPPDMAIRPDTDPVLCAQYYPWLITAFGIEHASVYYPIDAERLAESDWVEHLSDKEWTGGRRGMKLFSEALALARLIFGVEEEEGR
jgi:hypothetical protein